MQNFIMPEIIRGAYEKVIDGESLREVAKIYEIERRKLKKAIEDSLEGEELEKFKNAINKRNYKENKNPDRKISKKSKALNSDKYKEIIDNLDELGVNPDWIEKIYSRCQENRHTLISKDTLAFKLLDLLNFFNGRNKNMSPNDDGYIGIEDVLDMIIKNPRMISMSLGSIESKLEFYTKVNLGNVSLTNEKLKRNPGILRKKLEPPKYLEF